jgi:hypothetical protein
MSLSDAFKMINGLMNQYQNYRDFKVRLSGNFIYMLNGILSVGNIQDMINMYGKNDTKVRDRNGDVIIQETAENFYDNDVTLCFNKKVILNKYEINKVDDSYVLDLFTPEIMIDIKSSVGKDAVQLS